MSELKMPEHLINVENKIVLTFDMWSSQEIMEDLADHNKLDLLIGFLRYVREGMTDFEYERHYAETTEKKVHFITYKFTGDGWILIFHDNTPADDILRVVAWISHKYWNTFVTGLQRELKRTPDKVGLRFGIDAGKLYRVRWNQSHEYIGIPLMRAERLQSALKKFEYGASQIMLTAELFQSHFKDAKKIERFKPTKQVANLKKTPQTPETEPNLVECVELTVSVNWKSLLKKD